MTSPIKQLFDAEPRSPLIVAVNRVLVKNDPQLMRMMREVGSKMCLATALTPGFRGYDLMRQVGACPMGLRWGAHSDMGGELSHAWVDQFTWWDSIAAHESFHENFEDIVVMACAGCGQVMLDGPEELIYRVVKADLPRLVSKNQMLKLGFERNGDTRGFAMDSGETVQVLARHAVRPGKEATFEEGEAETMELLRTSPGMIGYVILKRIGVSTLGSAHATVASIMEDMKSASGQKLVRTAEPWEGYALPAEYLLLVEWESLQDAQRGMPHVNTRPELLHVHGPKVLDNCLRVPSVNLMSSMQAEHGFRDVLNAANRK